MSLFKLFEGVAMNPDFKERAGIFLSEVINLLRGVLVEVSLYGSVVRGEMHEGSDVDVLVIVRGGREEALKALESIYGSLWEQWVDLIAEGCVLELMVIGEEEWRSMVEKGFSFPMNVEEDKIVVYRGSWGVNA
jgi:predicted nucleotidyltransferase